MYLSFRLNPWPAETPFNGYRIGKIPGGCKENSIVNSFILKKPACLTVGRLFYGYYPRCLISFAPWFAIHVSQYFVFCWQVAIRLLFNPDRSFQPHRGIAFQYGFNGDFVQCEIRGDDQLIT